MLEVLVVGRTKRVARLEIPWTGSYPFAPMPQQLSPERVGTAAAIREAALHDFYERGYHGSSTRSIAKGAGIGVATLFHHYPSKDSILAEIVHGSADAMQADLDRELAGVTEPVPRLTTAARTMVVASCERQRESFVAQSEFRSLASDAFKINREKRRGIQQTFLDIVAGGIASQDFACRHPADVARSLVLLNSSVALWYQAGHGMTVDEMAAVHVDMSLDLVRSTR
jgi:AcrR family transcriptional regulator